MTVQTGYRPRRPGAPEVPQGEIVLQPPPVLPRGTGQVPVQLLFMLPMMLGMGAMSFVYIIPSLLFFFFARKYLIRGVMAGALAGS